jgi:hypothetical protein
MKRSILTIVIPVRSEAEALPTTISHLEKTVKTPHIVLIVDDHVDSHDKTPVIVKKLVKRFKKLFWLPKTSRDPDGFGPALCRAVKTITTPYTVFVMGDGCDDPHSIDHMMTLIQKTHTDVVAGSRYIKGGKKLGGPWLQHLFSLALNKFLQTIGLYTSDATNAFKLYKTSFLQTIIPSRPLPGVEFSLQLSIEGYKKQGRYKEIPTTWRGRTKGSSKLKLFKNGKRYLKLAIKALSI